MATTSVAAADEGLDPALAGILAGQRPDHEPVCWLGQPNSLSGPCTIQFGSGATGNVVLVGHHREAVLGMTIASAIALAAQSGPNELRFMLVDGEAVDDRLSRQLRHVLEQIPHEFESVGPGACAEAIAKLGDGMTADASTPKTMLLVLGLQRLRDLRMADAFDFSGERGPGEGFADILSDGPEHGIHSWIWCDSADNLGRSLNRTAQRSIGQRIAFQMSTGDSSDLIDDGAASRLGLHHALHVDLASGLRTKFRPYLAPPNDVIDDMLTAIHGRWR